MIESELLSIRIFTIAFFCMTIFTTDSVLKTNPWSYKINGINGEKIIGTFYEKELLLSKL